MFTHLHVASGYSLRHGASSPAALVGRAAEQGHQALALTDRDGLYGAIKFVTACSDAGITPLLGVDLAVEPTGLVPAPPARRPAPARGGSVVDVRLPRVTVLVHGGGPAGWTRLCRLVSATHLRGERGTPVSTTDLVAEHARHPTDADEAALTVLLGPASELGRAVLARRTDLARAVLARWYDALPLGALAIEVVCHLGPEGTPGSLGHAARMLALARDASLPAVLSNAVRHATPDGAATVDVLDAARRLVPLDARHLDRTTAQGHLKGAAEMAALARQVADAAGDRSWAARLLADTEAVAARCRLDVAADLGIGRVHLPEPEVVTRGEAHSHAETDAILRRRCEAGISWRYPGASSAKLAEVGRRLDDELATIATLRYPTYFLTVAEVCEEIRDMGVRVAARGSGAGSLVNHLLGISGVDPLAHGLLMERFCTTERVELPDIDIDVESARRTEVYERVLERFGGDRVSCVSMMDTYRVRHAVRDVGAALGLPPSEVDVIAKSFPHIRARDARNAIAELPELRSSGLGARRLDLLFDLVEGLDALPRHVALHPCGVLLSDATLGDRTPVEASWLGFPMSQFDKDDVEVLGLLKLDILGIRMQSAMSHAVDEIVRTDGGDRIELDDVPLDDEPTFRLIRSTRTLGCFQIESPGQRELVGKFAPQDFADLITDISLFRPGPVKSDMVAPFLRARQGWDPPDYLHPSLREALEQTYGVVVFHEQVLQIVATTTGVSLAEADEVRREMGSPDGQVEVEAWWRPLAGERMAPDDVDRIWAVLKAFASFGFCKAHAAAFALPTYQSAWLKAHHPAAFLAGVLTHDPGMYPKRLILDDARNLGIAVLGLDVNRSGETYRVEKVEGIDVLDHEGSGGDQAPRSPGYRTDAAVPDGRGYGIRLSLADVKGISSAEVARVVAGQPYHSLADFWHRARVTRPVAERLVVTGGFDSLYGLGGASRGRGRLTRRDLLLQLAELERWTRGTERATRAAGPRSRRPARSPAGVLDVTAAAARQSRAAQPVAAADEQSVQMALDLGDAPEETVVSGLPEMTGAERVRAELEVLGLDASRHVVDFYAPVLRALGTTSVPDLVRRRSRSELLVAGVKVATQTPPVRSGRRVVFLTLDDSTGPVDATFFEDVQGPYAATVFGSWLLVVRGVLRRTGPRGVSLRATGAWDLTVLWDAWTRGGIEAVHAQMAPAAGYGEPAIAGAAASRSSRPVVVGYPPAYHEDSGEAERQTAAARRAGVAAAAGDAAGDAATRRVLVHASGFRQSPYADVKPPGEDTKKPPRKLWHSSPGSSGR
ncbi:MAG TPA: DNA polymerase III subunit alpha [Actinomycetales bacterium]|nr:DNA polymerase III subunit alpha [Actinomycetales bacterium]